VSAGWLKAHLLDPDLVVVYINHRMGTTVDSVIPGSVALDYMAITRRVGNVSTELLTPDSLQAVIAAAGISNTSRVVVYSQDPIMAARGFMTLEVAGLDRVQVLNGGPNAWRAAGGTLEPPGPAPRRGNFTIRWRPNVVVDADWVRARLDDPKVALIDTRTPGEYTGTGERHGIASEGHLAGARLLIWEELFQPDSTFKPRSVLETMYRERGAEPGKTVVTYCYLGYRASLSYFVARYLGHDARFYDGSYMDWSQRGFPLVKGEKPR
jgi:thiosulfate/3-mercaptopyruvate sulfurtransferase